MASIRSVHGYCEETMLINFNMLVRHSENRSVWIHWNDHQSELVSPHHMVMDDFGNLVALN